MSDSLKQDVINAVGLDKYIEHCKEIGYMFDDAENGICSNVNNAIKNDNDALCKNNLKLYTVQFSFYHKNEYHLINKFVYAIDEQDAKTIVLRKYSKFSIKLVHIFCKRIDIERGMMFNA